MVRSEVMLSSINVEGVNWRELARYARMTCPPSTWSRWRIRKFLPRRAKKNGVEPGITGTEALGESTDSEQWIFPNVQPSKHDIKTLIAACLAMGVKECFWSHVYSSASMWGGYRP